MKNHFCELIAEASDMWNERKGMDFTRDNRQLKNHYNRISKSI